MRWTDRYGKIEIEPNELSRPERSGAHEFCTGILDVKSEQCIELGPESIPEANSEDAPQEG
jgi:hypothetical protein